MANFFKPLSCTLALGLGLGQETIRLSEMGKNGYENVIHCTMYRPLPL